LIIEAVKNNKYHIVKLGGHQVLRGRETLEALANI
jgi:hypothetical protein